MTELLTSAQMRAIERAAIDSGRVTGAELMERAGQGVIAAIFAEWPELAGAAAGASQGGAANGAGQDENRGEDRGEDGGGASGDGVQAQPSGQGARAIVLCGPGNNGGDGFVVARLLHDRGWQVGVYFLGTAERLPPDARLNHDRWAALGPVHPVSALDFDTVEGAALAIDALFGIGLSRDLSPQAQGALALVTEARNAPPVVAIDIASGFDADSGQCREDGQHPGTYPHHVPALTVTFEAAKLGHYLAPYGALMSERTARGQGRLVVVPLGLAAELADLSRGSDLCGLEQASPLRRFDLDKPVAGHKFANGHALVLAGGPGRGGAGRLAARGALRMGAGLVTLGCPEAALAENAARLDAVMLKALPDPAALAAALADPRITALCLGPGFGTGAPEAALLAEALKSRRRTLLDADALTLIARDPALFALLHGDCVLTPHHGEFARLFPDLAERLGQPLHPGPIFSKVEATRQAAARAGCTLLFKGPDTVIAAASGATTINAALYERAAPWLATAGSGDVLAGFITGLLARGLAPIDAAATGAWLHVECARSFGPGLIAEDLPEELPLVFRRLLGMPGR